MESNQSYPLYSGVLPSLHYQGIKCGCCIPRPLRGLIDFNAVGSTFISASSASFPMLIIAYLRLFVHRLRLPTQCDGCSHGCSAFLVIVINSIEPVRTHAFPSIPFFSHNRLLRTCGLLARHLFILGHVSSYSACLPELQQFAPACRDRILNIPRTMCGYALRSPPLSGARL